MKFILLLILMLNMSLAFVCPGTKFIGVQKSKFPFAGKNQYLKEYSINPFKDEVFNLEKFEMDNIEKGILKFTEKEEEKEEEKEKQKQKDKDKEKGKQKGRQKGKPKDKEKGKQKGKQKGKEIGEEIGEEKGKEKGKEIGKEEEKDSAEVKRNYYSSNLKCAINALDEYVPDSPILKPCVLEFISLDQGYFFVKQIKFTYYNNSDSDCEDLLQKSLDNALTCKIDYLETDYQILYLPFTDNNNKYIKFNTKTKTFELDNGGLVNDISIEINKDNASLLQNKKEIAEFKKADSCYALLRKIKALMSKPLEGQCPEGNEYSYFKFKFNDNEVTDSSINIPAKGTLKLNSLVDIIINDTSHAFKSGTYKELDNIPVYEGFNFELTFIDNAGGKYTFWLNFHSKDCIKILKERLVSIQSCPNEASKLYYYSQINLQNGIETI
jgi:hypothetical protein